MSPKKQLYVALFGFLIATFPIFFEIYRTALAKSVPYDDYAPYLLYLTGDGGYLLEAPWAYRILSVAVAIPFYYLLPAIRFTNLANIDPAYLKATQALCFTAYLAIILTAVVVYLIARKKCHASKASAVVIALLSFFLGAFEDRFAAVDPLGTFYISLLVLVLDSPLIFAGLVLLAVGFNEKIPLIFTVLLGCRWLFNWLKKEDYAYYVQLIAAILGVAGYFVIRLVLIKIPGYEQQVTPSMFMDNIIRMVQGTLSMKGIYLNLLPSLLLAMVVWLAVRYRHRTGFQVADVAGVVFLFSISFVVDISQCVGRIVMYTYPLYLPAIAAFLDDLLETRTDGKGA